MARIFIDGFESGTTDLWVATSAVITTPKTGMSGSYCLSLDGAQKVVKREISSATSIYGAFKYYQNNAGAASLYMCTLRSSGNLVFTISVQGNTGIITSATAGASSVDATASIPYQITVNLEFYFYIDNTNGRMVVKINGVPYINFTGDTLGTHSTFNGFELGMVATSTNVYGFFDDVVLDDSDWPGNTIIQAIKADGAGNSAQWTTSVSTPNWQTVDEVPASDVDYVYTNTVDQTDTHTAGSLVGTIASIKCVQVQARTIKEGAATPTNLGVVVRTNSTDYVSSDIAVPTALTGLSVLWNTNPSSTGVAWDVTAVNALEIGIKSKA
jgi:hypothetical protein